MFNVRTRAGTEPEDASDPGDAFNALRVSTTSVPLSTSAS